MSQARAALSTFAFLALAGFAAAACSSSQDTASNQPSQTATKPRPVESAPTFSGTVEWILQERCQKCHHSGGIAPFSLMTYEEIKGVAEVAREKVEAREMPPWGAFDDETCKVNHKWKDDLRLSEDDVKKFSEWVKSGMPMGDPALRPAPKTFPPDGLLTKTHTLQIAKPHEVPADGGKDDIRCFPVNPGFTQDTWVGGVNVVPGAPRVVHHVIVYVDPNGDSVKNAGAAGSYPCFGGPDVSSPSLLLAWAPGSPPVDYGDDTALKITKNSMLVVQVHYHPTNQSLADQTKFELKVLEGKPTFAVNIVLLGNADSPNGPIKLLPGPNDPAAGPAFVIPANVPDHTETMEVVMPETIQGFPLPELRIRATGTHMHWAGVDMKVNIDRAKPSADQPAKECLVGTPKYDFNWQRGYEYDEPFEKMPSVAAGDKLTFSCKYNNTMSNKRVRKALSDLRQSAPSEISLGEQTLDEMCLGVLVAIRRATLAD